MTGNTHEPPGSVGNLEKVEVARARQNNRRLKSGVCNVASAFEEGAIVGMKRNAKALLSRRNLCVGRRSEWAVGWNTHAASDT